MARTTPALVLTILVLWMPTLVAAQDMAQAVADTHDYMSRLEELGFAGALAISYRGEPVLAEGYGLADRENGTPWTPATVSTIGSITKQFTGAAILLLAEDGKLSVEDRIGKYFEGVPADKEAITLHHLLTHSSGIVDLDGFGDWDPIGREEFVRRILDQPLQFAPGEGYEYSNAGYSLLGAIIEQLSGTSYERFVRERLFVPQGMYETGYILPEWGKGRIAQGYRSGERWGTVLERPFAPDGPYWVLRANGGIHTTVYDMLRWAQALVSGRVLKPESLQAYWAPHVSEGGDSSYGYGWVILDMDGTKVVTHNGGNGIFFADMAIVPSMGLAAIVQTNVLSEFAVAGQLLEQIGQRFLAGQPYTRLPKAVRISASMLESYAGAYQLAGDALRVTVEDNALRVEAGGAQAFSHLLSIRPVDAARAERLSRRIEELVTAYVGGDWKPLWEAYGRPGPLKSFAARAEDRRKNAEEEHGPFARYKVLGTAFRDGRDVTLVRFFFERGTEDRAYVWAPDEEENLRGTSLRGLASTLLFVPEEDGAFTSWDPRSGAVRRMRFERDAEGGLVLVLGEGEAAVRASRLP